MGNNKVVEITKKLISLKTTEGNISSKFTDILEQILYENKYSIKKISIEGIPNYLAYIEGKGPHLAFIGHYDVVPAGSGWDQDAFIPKEKDGKIFGRGASDMKGALATQIVVGKKLAELGFYISLFISGDEEKTNGVGMPNLLKINKKPIDYVIGGEPTAKEISGDVIKSGRRGILQGNIIIKGISGHAAYPEKASNPIHNFFRISQDLVKEIDTKKSLMPATSFQITNIFGGEGHYNVIPGEVTLKFDIRNSEVTPVDEVEKIISTRLKKLCKNFEINITCKSNPFLTINEEFLSKIKKSIINVIGSEPKLSFEGGTSDCRFIAAMNSKIPIIEIGVPSENIHGANEFVTIKNLDLLERIYLEIGKNLLKY